MGTAPSPRTYIALAYTVMAYTAMAYVVMAYIVTAYVVMAPEWARLPADAPLSAWLGTPLDRSLFLVRDPVPGERPDLVAARA